MKGHFKIKAKGETVKGLLENPASDKLMILVHGFTGNMHGPGNIFDKLSNRLQKDGFAVIRFNFRGTPPSEGRFEDMTVKGETKDLKEIIKFAKSRGYKKIGVLGESLGGTILANSYDKSLKVVVFWYPAFDLFDTDIKDYFSKEKQKELSANGFILEGNFHVGRDFVNEIKKIKLFSKMALITSPALFLHGDKDSQVPYQQSEKACKLAKGEKEIRIIKGADHCFRNEQDEVINLTLKFLKKHF